MRLPVIVKLLLLITSCLVYIEVQGQYYFEKITEENGLSDNRVTCILKDKTGFLWIGTKNGLNRYDGNSFKIFTPSVNQSISNETINDLVQDSIGRIWVSTMNGLNVYDPATNKWQTIVNAAEEPKQLPNNLNWDIEVDESNNLWIVADVWELSKYEPDKKKFTHYDWPSFKEQKMFSAMPRYRSIQKIKRKSKNEWWLATTIGLCSMEINSGKFTAHAVAALGSIRDIYYDSPHGKVYITNETGSLYCYNESQNHFTEIKPSIQSYPATYWVKDKTAGSYVLIANAQGIVEINTTDNHATLINYQPALAPSLSPGGTNVIYKDNTDIIWVGTNKGVNFYDSRNHSADFIPLTQVEMDDDEDGMSAAIYDSVERKYYITSIHSRELFSIDEKTGTISSIRAIGGKPLTACTNICLDRQNDLWLLTETHVYKYDRINKQFHLFQTPNGEKSVVFNGVLNDKQGNYWFATWQDGLYYFNNVSKQYYLFGSTDSISAKNITALANDPVEDAVWIGTYNYGPYRYDLGKKNFINYTETPAAPQYLQMTLIKDVGQGKDGKLWFSGFGSGLHVYHHGKSFEKSFTSISFKDGLPGSSYYSITPDHKNRIWLLSRQGLSAIDGNGKYLYDAIRHPATRFANFAPGTSYIKRIFYNGTKDEILVPVAGGLLIYYPDREVPSSPFPVVLTDFIINSASSIYNPSLISGKTIEIPYKSNSISIQFAALDFRNAGDIIYEYKLQENDPEWKFGGRSNTLNFPRLSPGEYNLLVRAKGPGGKISSNTVSLSFRVLPPFWLTWWFITGMLLIVGYLLYRWINYLRQKLKSQQIANYFATSLYGQNTTEDVFWDIAKNCVSQLKFADCVVYLYDPGRKLLIQKAAYGPKNPEKHMISNAIDIPLGQGIVGSVALQKKAEIVNDTSKDKRYIVDDERRLSEIAVPIIVDNQIFGVIDSEHPRKRYFKKYHLRILNQIAAICSDKLSKYIVQERLRAKISRDLHDEIGSSLTSINVLSKVALSKASEDIAGYLHKIKDTTSQSMESMSDMVWAINPRNDKLDAMMSRMKEFAANMCEARGINLEFYLPAELEGISLDIDKRRNLFLVFKEAVNNSVKYSATDKLVVRIEKLNGFIQMVIQDKGTGFDSNKVRTGNGLHNMEERARDCGGQLTIESSIQKGTRIVFQIPSPDLG